MTSSTPSPTGWTESQWHEIVFEARQAHAYRAFAAAERNSDRRLQLKLIARGHEANVIRCARSAEALCIGSEVVA